MKKHLAKIKKVVWATFEVASIIFILIYLSIYLSGVRRLNVGGVKLNFDSVTVMSIFVLAYANSVRGRVDDYLSARDANLTEVERKHRRWSSRFVLWAAWLVIFLPTYVYGRTYYASIGNANFSDLLLVLLYGIFGIGTAVPMPRAKSQSDKEPESESSATP